MYVLIRCRITKDVNLFLHYNVMILLVFCLQVRVHHVDSHYCAAAWRYLREFSILHKELVSLVSLDDKHKVKVGEPSYPLAAAERGKQVIVGPNEVMAVGDHYFLKCSLTPSVIFIVSEIS